MRGAARVSRTVVCGLALLTLVGCARGTTAKTYVNQNNPAETLTLEDRFSLHNSVYNKTHDFHMYSGVFTLKTTSGTTTGTYTSGVSKQKTGLVFQPKEGKMWGVELRSDSTFENERGTWTLKPGA